MLLRRGRRDELEKMNESKPMETLDQWSHGTMVRERLRNLF